MPFALVFSPLPAAADTAAAGWDERQRAAMVALLREIDPGLADPIPDDDGSLSLVPRKGIGLDWQFEPARIVVEPQVAGLKPARAEQVFALLLQSAAALSRANGLVVHATALDRAVDLEADHEVLARAWIAHCSVAAQQHLEATRAGSRFNVVAVAVLLAILLAASQLPAAWHAWLALLAAVPLAFLVLLWFRRRARDD